MKNKYAYLVFLFLISFSISAQTADSLEILKPIHQLFDGMRAGDSTMVRQAFAKNAGLMTTFTDKSGKAQVRPGSVDDFAKSVGTPHDKVFDERIFSYKIRRDNHLATVWTEYSFFLGEDLSHCGVNAFHLFESDAGWKIIHITDTRSRTGCKGNEKAVINELMDNWHKAAATADEDTFFGSMTADGIYLGTDETERWLRDEIKEWSKEYFAKDSAWDFTPLERHISLSEDRQTAWFDEKLDTWMGVCRGSGVLSWTAAGWKIRQYNLAVLIPNDKINGFLELIGKEPRK